MKAKYEILLIDENITMPGEIALTGLIKETQEWETIHHLPWSCDNQRTLEKMLDEIAKAQGWKKRGKNQ